jgi:hypothetical protein
VVITNNGATNDAILSITNVKVTYSSKHTDGIQKSYFTVTASKIMDVVRELNKLEDDDVADSTASNITMTSASLSLEDEILMNFYFEIKKDAQNRPLIDMSQIEDVALLSWNEKVTADKATYSTADGIVHGYVTDGTKYMVQTTGIAAKRMGDDLWVRVYMKAKDGTVTYGPIVSYSPETYCYSRLAKSSSVAMKKLCVAMLNYGAAAQLYFDYNSKNLVNADLKDLSQYGITDMVAYSSSLIPGSNATVNNAYVGEFIKSGGFDGKESASVSFEGALAINYYFTPATAITGDVTFYYWNAADYAAATTGAKPEGLTYGNATGSMTLVATGDGRYWANTSGIAAKDMDKPFYFTAVYKNGNTTYCSGVKVYSVSKYCAKKISNNASSDALKAFAEATAIYGYYADAYFPNN